MMKNSFFATLGLLAFLSVLGSGCRQQPAVNTELEKAVSALANATPAPPASPEAAPAPAPALQMKQAMEAYQSGKLDDTVTRLQTLRATPTLTPQQLLALNDAMATVMNDLYARAAKGDANAVKAVKQYERLQNQQR